MRRYHKVTCFSEFPVQFHNNTTFIISHRMSFHNKCTLEFWVMYDSLAHDRSFSSQSQCTVTRLRVTFSSNLSWNASLVPQLEQKQHSKIETLEV